MCGAQFWEYKNPNLVAEAIKASERQKTKAKRSQFAFDRRRKKRST